MTNASGGKAPGTGNSGGGDTTTSAGWLRVSVRSPGVPRSGSRLAMATTQTRIVSAIATAPVRMRTACIARRA
jgi:hypothetical protein